jgi:hypothetical protein
LQSNLNRANLPTLLAEKTAMADAPPPLAFQELMRFGKEHSRATLLMRVAAHDYAAARCLLFNGMFEGLVLGAQAIEKVLKSYQLFDHPKLSRKTLNHHSLPMLLNQASVRFPQLPLEQFAPLIEKFTQYYKTRYPDNSGVPESKTTGDVRGLDEVVIFLSENIPCPRNVKYRVGIYPLITFSFESRRAEMTTWEMWIKHDNRALSPLLPRINLEYAAVMKTLYPQNTRWS